MSPLCFAILLLSFSFSSVFAAPNFQGLKNALPAPGAAVLNWNRASGDNKKGSVTYHIYQKTPSGWNFQKPVEKMSGTDWAITGLAAGKDYEFIVRAKDGSGEDQNTKTMTVRPNNAYPREEFRGAWVSRFEWRKDNQSVITKRLKIIMETLGDSNMNAVVFQVRGQGDTLYPSKEEPWSPLVASAARNFDPIKEAISLAHQNNIQFHAWVNLSVIWQSGSKKLPSDMNHPFYKFADERNPNNCLGVIHDSSGKPKLWGSSDYVWLSHGNPEVNSYLRRQVMNFLKDHDVDGVHIDDRTGNPSGVSYDPISKKRFAGRGNPSKMTDMGEWQRDQLTRFLSNLYVQIKAKNPKLLVSASPFGIADRKRIPGYGNFSDCERFGVQPEKWLRLGVIDALTPQIYWDLPDKTPNYAELVRDWMTHNRTGRPIWPGSALGKYGATQPLDPMQLRYVAITRAYGLNGNNFYNFSGAKPDQWRAAAKKMYPTKAMVPVPNHMKAPLGQVMGHLVDANKKPLVDCWVAIGGRKYTYLTSADGFFGIPNLKSGNHTLFFSGKPGQTLKKQITVQNGQTTTVNIKIP